MTTNSRRYEACVQFIYIYIDDGSSGKDVKIGTAATATLSHTSCNIPRTRPPPPLPPRINSPRPHAHPIGVCRTRTYYMRRILYGARCTRVVQTPR